MVNPNFNNCRVCGVYMNPVASLVGGALENREGPICRACVDLEYDERFPDTPLAERNDDTSVEGIDY